MKMDAAEQRVAPPGLALFFRLPTTSWWAKLSAAPPALGSISEACVCEHWNSTMAETTFDLSKTNPAQA